MLRARANRIGQIFRLRRGHHEDHFVRRLFERFQQRVGGFVGEHVRFVEDHDFVASAGGRVAHHVAQFAHLVDAAIGGGVDLNHVQRIAGGDFAAGIALIARRRGWGPLTQLSALARMRAVVVLPTPRAPGKNVGVRHAPARAAHSRACA